MRTGKFSLLEARWIETLSIRLFELIEPNSDLGVTDSEVFPDEACPEIFFLFGFEFGNYDIKFLLPDSIKI